MKDGVSKIITGVILSLFLSGFIFTVNIQHQPNNPKVGQDITFHLNENTLSCTNSSWTFGDGGTKNGVNSNESVVHSYKDPGSYTVNFTYNGCPPETPRTVPISIMITVSDDRSITITPGNPKVGDQVSFTLNNNKSSSIKWNFGDNQITLGNVNQNYTYQSSGNFAVKAFDFGGTAQIPVTVNVNVTDNRAIIINPAQAKIGEEVTLILQNAVTSSVKWNFGDNVIKNGQATEKHIYKKKGSFNIKAFDFNGSAPQPLTAAISITDTRQILMTPAQAKVGQEISFTLKDAAASNVKWNFGDSVVKNGQVTEKHTYKKQGNFTVKVFDFNGNGQPPITTSCNVQDIRKIKLIPQQPKVGEKVKIILEDAATQNVKWDFGFGSTKMGLSTEEYVFLKEGNFTIKAYDFNGTSQQPLTKMVMVNDNRKIQINPPNPKVGQIVKFTPQNFNSNSLKWKINYESEKYGQFFNYKFLTSGLYKLEVSETIANVVLKKEITFNVTEIRTVSWTPQNPKAGEKVKFETQNFQFPRILWDYGDGFRNLNNTSTEHIFDEAGNYVVKVVDDSGKDPKEFRQRINIGQDPRVVVGPQKQISAGEKISLNAKGFYDQNLEWDLGNNQKISGKQILSHKFSKPGIYQVKVKDRSGKDKKSIMYQVHIKDDPRKVTASKSSAKVEETVKFKAENFYDKKIKWNFGDNKTMIAGSEVSHQFGKNGVYYVKAIDYAGKDEKTFSVKVEINIARSHVSELMISGGEIYFENTKRHYSVVPEDFKKLKALVQLKFEGTGKMFGSWYLDGKKYATVNKNLSFGQSTVFELKSVPTIQPGLHILKFKSDDPKSKITLNAYYFVSVGKEKVYLLAPKSRKILKGKQYKFKWKNPSQAVVSKLYFSTDIKSVFKKPVWSVTVSKDQQKTVIFPKGVKGKVFWYIAVFDSNKKQLGTSDIGVFNLE